MIKYKLVTHASMKYFEFECFECDVEFLLQAKELKAQSYITCPRCGDCCEIEPIEDEDFA